MTLLFAFLICGFCAAIDHWVGGARLFRGEQNAIQAELYNQTNGTKGKSTWYWDKRWIPYAVFGVFIAGIVGTSSAPFWVAGLITGTYFWFRSRSPREIFPAGNGQNILQIYSGIKAGAVIGLIGFAPMAFGGFHHWWLVFTPLLAIPIGLYHFLFHGDPLFRSYGELCQGGLVLGPIVSLLVLT